MTADSMFVLTFFTLFFTTTAGIIFCLIINSKNKPKNKFSCFNCKYHDYDDGDMYSQHGGRMICHKNKEILYGKLYLKNHKCFEKGFDFKSFIKSMDFMTIPSNYNRRG